MPSSPRCRVRPPVDKVFFTKINKQNKLKQYTVKVVSFKSILSQSVTSTWKKLRCYFNWKTIMWGHTHKTKIISYTKSMSNKPDQSKIIIEINLPVTNTNHHGQPVTQLKTNWGVWGSPPTNQNKKFIITNQCQTYQFKSNQLLQLKN
jgi:hypothetical protein